MMYEWEHVSYHLLSQRAAMLEWLQVRASTPAHSHVCGGGLGPRSRKISCLFFACRCLQALHSLVRIPESCRLNRHGGLVVKASAS